MSNNHLPAVQSSAGALTEGELLNVLRASLYPGAKDESIKLVLSYCKAAGLDPMMKPCHIVPMWSKESNSMRDVIMPGIGLYRVQAARTGCYAGMSDPEFGPMRELTIGDSTTSYPEWCKVTVQRRMPDGFVAEFSAVEYWVENYATAKRDTQRPNEMWARRPRGQLAKVCEAQALRKAFPEIGSMPTMEEMDGSSHAADDVGVPPVPEPAPPPRVGRRPKADAAPAPKQEPEQPPPADVTDIEPKTTEQQPEQSPGQRALEGATASLIPDQAQQQAKPEAKKESAGTTKPNGAYIGLGEITYLRKKAASLNIEMAQLLADAGGLCIDRLTKAEFSDLLAYLRSVEDGSGAS